MAIRPHKCKPGCYHGNQPVSIAVSAYPHTKPTPDHFRVMTICGSMRYYDEMLRAAQENTALGWIVLMPFVAEYAFSRQPDDVKTMLDRMHRVKIDMATDVLIVGCHIGESTAGEIAYAQETGKPVTYWNRVTR
jgi:hypothetical protein